MRQTFVIDGRLDGLNEYVNACRSHRRSGARMKRDNQDIVLLYIKAAKLKPFDKAVNITYTFYEKPCEKNGAIRDKSNIASFAVKVIEDALQEAGIIENDNWKWIADYSCRFFRATENPRIVVELEEA